MSSWTSTFVLQGNINFEWIIYNYFFCSDAGFSKFIFLRHNMMNFFFSIWNDQMLKTVAYRWKNYKNHKKMGNILCHSFRRVEETIWLLWLSSTWICNLWEIFYHFNYFDYDLSSSIIASTFSISSLSSSLLSCRSTTAS